MRVRKYAGYIGGLPGVGERSARLSRRVDDNLTSIGLPVLVCRTVKFGRRQMRPCDETGLLFGVAVLVRVIIELLLLLLVG